MKAIRINQFGPPEVMKMEEAADPQPGPGQALIRIRAAGVNPVDAYLRSGAYRPDFSLPYTPGIDGAGVIEAVGPGVKAWRPGQRVYFTWAISGSYAEKTVCQESHVYPLPEKISFAQGAAIGVPYGTAYRALFQRAMAAPGETVLVHGASGGVGLAAVQIAHAAGLKVIGTAGSEKGMELVRRQAAHGVVNHKKTGYQGEIMQFTEGRGVQILLEMMANVNLSHDLRLLAQGGRVVVIGGRGPVEIDPSDLMKRDAAILGMVLFNISPQDLASAHAAILVGLEQGTLNPIVSREMSLAEAVAAHHAILETSSLGKIVLVP